MEFTIYSVGNIEFLYQILNSVAMICGTGDFAKLVSIGFLLGILYIGFQTIYQGGQRINIAQTLTCFIIYLCMFGPSCTVVLEDVYEGRNRVVDNVPLGVGASGMAISNIGFKITQMFEQGFGDVQRTTEHGYAHPLQIVNNIRSMTMSDKLFEAIDRTFPAPGEGHNYYSSREALMNYLTDCTMVNVALGVTNKEVLKKSTWGANFQCASEAHGTKLPLPGVPNQGYVSCNAGWTYLNDTFDSSVNQQAFKEVINLAIGAASTNDQGAPVPDQDFDELQDGLSTLGFDLQGTQELMKTLCIESVYDDAAAQFYATYQDRVSAVAVRQAIMQRNTQWAAESEMFLNSARALMSFFEGFLYAITPIMGLLIGVGGFGLSLVGKYFLLIAWVQLWMPVLAITNLYTLLGARSDVVSALGSLEDVSMYGFNELWVNNSTWVATGGMLCAATPMIALFLITGSHYAFTSLAGRLGGQDHFNEKTVTPDAAVNGPAIQNAPMHTRTMGEGVVMSGASIPKINLQQSYDNAMSETMSNIDAYARQAALASLKSTAATNAVGSTKQQAIDNTDHFQSALVDSKSTSLTDTVQTSSQAMQSAARESGLTSSLGGKLGASFGGDASAGGVGGKNFSIGEGWKAAKNTRKDLGNPTTNPFAAPVSPQGGLPTQRSATFGQTQSGNHDISTGLYASGGLSGGINLGGDLSFAATERATDTNTFNKASSQGRGAGETKSDVYSYIDSRTSDLKKLSADQLREEAQKTDNQAYSDQLNLLASEVEKRDKLLSMRSSFGINQELNLAQATQGMSAREADDLDKFIGIVGMSKYSMDSDDRARYEQIDSNTEKYARALGGDIVRGRAAAQMAFLLQTGEASHMEFMQKVLDNNAHAVHTNPGMELPQKYQERDFSDQWVQKSDEFQHAEQQQAQRQQAAEKQLKEQELMPQSWMDHRKLGIGVVEDTTRANQAVVEARQKQEAVANIQNPPKELLGQEWASDLEKGPIESLFGDARNPAARAQYEGKWNDLTNAPERQRITGLTATQATFVGLAAKADTGLEAAGRVLGIETKNQQELKIGLNQLREENSKLMYGTTVDKLKEDQLNEVNKTTKGMALYLMGVAHAQNEGHAVAIKQFNTVHKAETD